MQRRTLTRTDLLRHGERGIRLEPQKYAICNTEYGGQGESVPSNLLSPHLLPPLRRKSLAPSFFFSLPSIMPVTFDTIRGLSGLAVSWGTWSGAGMAHRFGSGFEAYWKGLGMDFVPLGPGMRALRGLMGISSGPSSAAAASSAPPSPLAHGAVLPADWARYYRSRRGRPHPLAVALAEGAQEAKSTETGGRMPAQRGLIGILSATPPVGRLFKLSERLAGITGAVLGTAEEPAETDVPVVELGLTSVLVVELAGRLTEELFEGEDTSYSTLPTLNLLFAYSCFLFPLNFVFALNQRL